VLGKKEQEKKNLQYIEIFHLLKFTGIQLVETESDFKTEKQNMSQLVGLLPVES
jgi:hypothetical protein